VVFISLSITSLISSFLGLGFYLLSLGFWKGFILAFAIQTVGYALYSKIKDKQTLIEFQKIELAKKTKQIIQLTCSHCKKPVIVPISLNEENRFVCPECKESNLVIIQYTVAQVTTPKMAKIDIEIPKGIDLPENINIDETVKNFLLDNSKQNLRSKSNNKDKNKNKGNNEHN
jgi:Zn finger protein HypA/HybF involved in hydrogenase expression